ncbi:lipopolysaccharide assembly protein LapA domain-containing protein [Gordonia sp. PKS22-38]|uniref:Lipopolysaccharide assembly protein LapA domain-containing protein n=1 Tax=Gordonia prachuapensis TaxID=3115651 RepID=A0ABU7MQX4_9ACTN|nr:lipopolysaccharide assembly protein LapA domain-containing protein [Gordonia sp. PKS22-38]
MTTPDPQQQQPPVDGPDPIGSSPPPVPETDPDHQALMAERDALRTRVKKVEHTRTRATYFGVVIGAIVTILLLVFILQNLESQRIMLIFWEVNLPLGVSLLIAAIAGALIVAAVGGLRMLQMSRALRKARN